MEIISIKTRDDYDRILKHLEDNGYVLCDGSKPTTWGLWENIQEGNHCIEIDESNTLEYNRREYCEETRPDIKIQTVNEYIGTKFKVGDKVRIRKGEDLIRSGESAKIISKDDVGYVLKFDTDDYVDNSWLNCHLEKVEDVELKIEKPSHPMHESNGALYVDDMVFGVDFGPSTFNKLKDKTMEIVKFAKNLTLSSNEKLMRKKGLKDENGIYTDAYTEIVDNLVYSEYETKVFEIAKKAEEDDKKK